MEQLQLRHFLSLEGGADKLLRLDRFDRFAKGGRPIGGVRTIQFLSSDIIIMSAVGGTVMSGQSDIEPERNPIHTVVSQYIGRSLGL